MTSGDERRPEDAEVLRAQLHALVRDVRERPDSLAAVLSRARRRRSRRRPLALAGGIAVLTASVMVMALLIVPPARPPSGQQLVGLTPSSYLARTESGLLARFDLASGRPLELLAEVNGAGPGELAVDGERVLAVVARGSGQGVVELSPSAGRQLEVPVAPGVRVSALTAAAGRIAYLADGDAVVMRDPDGSRRRIAVPPGVRILDLALAGDGRLAVLVAAGGPHNARSGIHVLGRHAMGLPVRPPLRAGGGCGANAVAWDGGRLAVLLAATCDARAPVRIAVLDADTGERLGGGVPFGARVRRGGSAGVELSVDGLGRFLVSTGRRQWLIDGDDVRRLPRPCTADGACAHAPAVFWN